MEHNLTDQLSCDAISIPEWKLELMAKKIFEKVWGDQNKAILRACQMLESCQNSHSTAAMSAVPIQSKIEKIKKRKAMGAKERVILAQFVVEAATTSALGGFLGIVLGYVVSMAANRILPMVASGVDVTVSPSFNSIAVAFGISVGIGVLFGYLPAKRAARLNPIEALRYD